LRYAFWPSYRLYLAAFAVGIITPGRLGELARAAQLQRELDSELAPCVRSVVSDRLFDLLFLVALGPCALWAMLESPTFDGWWIASFLGLYAVGASVLAATGERVARWRVRWRTLRFATGCLGQAAGDLAGSAGRRASGYTFLAYVAYFVASWVLMRAAGIGLSLREAVWVTGCLSLILLLPISIGGIGTREAALLLLLGHYGVSREDALAYSVLQFAVFTLFGGLVGALVLAAACGRPNARQPAQLSTASSLRSHMEDESPRKRNVKL
jgi:uncharacterized membrane protein YbhN (UPF0104 family)